MKGVCVSQSDAHARSRAAPAPSRRPRRTDLAAISRFGIDQRRIGSEVEPDARWDRAVVEMTADGVLHLLLQFAQVSALGRNASAARSVPGCYQDARVISLDLENDLFHVSVRCGDGRTSR